MPFGIFEPKEPPGKYPHMFFSIHFYFAIIPQQENSSEDRNNGIVIQLFTTQKTIKNCNSIFIPKLFSQLQYALSDNKKEPFIPYLIKPTSGDEKILVVLQTAPKYYNGTSLNY